MKKGLVVGIIIGLIIGLVIGFLIFKFISVEDDDSEKCAKAGESIGENLPLDADTKITKCCEGLTKIYISDLDSNGNCENIMDISLCSNCGNNVCESWENKCNCPEDCAPLPD